MKKIKNLKKKLKAEWDAGFNLAKQLLEFKQELQSDKELTDTFFIQYERFQNVRKKIENKQRAIIRSISAEIEAPYNNNNSDENDNDDQKFQKQQYLDPTIQQTLQDEILERNREIINIEHDAIEILDLYKALQRFIVEQGELLINAEDNIVKAKISTIHAEEEIGQAEVYQKKAQKKQCWCLFLMVLSCLFILFSLSVILIYANIYSKLSLCFLSFRLYKRLFLFDLYPI